MSEDARRCPGEKYDITPAICRGRQAQSYSKCNGCKWRDCDEKGADMLPTSSEKIFKAYDIRGKYPDEINEKIAERVGMATAKFLGAETLVVSRDMRSSSESISQSLIKGIIGMGCNVIDIGLASTDANYFAIGHYEADGGIQVTASHNPPEDNGFKISREKAMPIGSASGLQNIKEIASRTSPRPADKPGKVEQRSITEKFADHVVGFAEGIPKVKMVIDAGNGMAGHMLPLILEKLSIDAVALYFDLDPSFPNHEANPLNHETLRDLQAKVIKTGADLGIAFDGDGDRCGFVDENGKVVTGDIITALIAKYILKREPGAHILFDVRSSRVVEEEVRRLGGVPVRERVGHAFMKASMRRRHAPFGGELSCHYYFRDNFYTDSGVIAMMHILNILGEEKRPFSELLAPLQRYHHSGEINFEVDDVEAKLREITHAFSDARIEDQDGLTVLYKDWWCNIRPSNTQSVLRLNLEANTRRLMEEKKSLVVDIITGKKNG